jgi:hypothetical protein
MEQERTRPRLGNIFVEKGLITPEQLAQALEHQAACGKLLGEVLIDLGMIDRLHLASALGVQFTSAPPPPAPKPAPVPAVDREAELAALRAHNAELHETVAQLQAQLADRDERLALLAQFFSQKQ